MIIKLDNWYICNSALVKHINHFSCDVIENQHILFKKKYCIIDIYMLLYNWYRTDRNYNLK